MSSSPLSFITNTFDSLLAPFPILAWFGIEVTTLDTLAVIRLCLILRQIRQAVRTSYTGKIQPSSFTKDALTTLVVVYGGEAVAGDFLFLAAFSLWEKKIMLNLFSSMAWSESFFHDLTQISIIVYFWTAHCRISSRGTSILLWDRRTPHVPRCANTFISFNDTSSANGSASPWYINFKFSLVSSLLLFRERHFLSVV